MIKVTKVVTEFDDKTFDNEKDARKHLDEKYGNLLTAMTHRIIAQEKYANLLTFLDENMLEFEDLIILKHEIIGEVADGREID